MGELILISVIFGTIQIVISLVCCYILNKKYKEIKKDVSNHHSFLLKVKNDIPQLWKCVRELEDQILPPDEYNLH